MYPSCSFEPVQHRHTQIHQDQSRMNLWRKLNGLPPVGGFSYFEALHLQRISQQLAYIRLVINNKNSVIAYLGRHDAHSSLKVQQSADEGRISRPEKGGSDVRRD